MTAEPTPLSQGSSSSKSSLDGISSCGSSVLAYYQNGDDSSLSGRSSPDKMDRSIEIQSDQREFERQEARVIRSAIEEIDLEEEQRVLKAAREEAVELVWKNENSGAPYPLSQPPSISWEPGSKSKDQQGSKDGSYIQGDLIDQPSEVPDTNEVQSEASRSEEATQQIASHKSPSRKLSNSFSLSRLASRRRSSDALQNISGNNQKVPLLGSSAEIHESSKLGAQGYEGNEKPALLSQARRNPFARAQSSKQHRNSSLEKPKTSQRFFNRVEIQRNPPSQSKDPSYISNPSPPLEILQSTHGQGSSKRQHDQTQYKDGKEVRGDDIRAATSMRIRDRSPNLPSPTVISDKPGRPIVSFDHDWKPSESDKAFGQGSQPNAGRLSATYDVNARSPRKSSSTPVIPTSQAPIEREKKMTGMSNPSPCSVPEIDIPEEEGPSVPQINLQPTPTVGLQDTSKTESVSAPMVQEPDTPSTDKDITPTPLLERNLPRINEPRLDHKESSSPRFRPSPRHSATAPSSLPHRSPAIRTGTATALCAQCALPIQGRILTAAGTRFHPECFVCHHCHQALECVEFFPEPDDKRDARLERIERRMEGEDVEAPAGSTPEDDNDDSLRFYCALDFHEFFSPRCKSCKTPIEGEVIVACGAEWHVGHFFCAQCGDVSCRFQALTATES